MKTDSKNKGITCLQKTNCIKAVCVFFTVTILLSGCRKMDYNIAKPGQQKTNTISNRSIASPQRPNIIVILADDIGFEIPTYSGGQSYSTPNLDAMAQGGMQFSQCNASPLCSPSRFMLLTGKYNFRNYTQWGVMDTTQRTIANMMRNAGYATGISGKWQLAGGAASVNALGFDKYMVYDAFDGADVLGESESSGRQYKDPQVYVKGANLADSIIKGKYGEDFFRQYLFDFIDSNINKPFFALWTPNLGHTYYAPTPDDPQFASWNSKAKPLPGDTVYFKPMVKYLDKEIGMLMAKLNAAGIAQNTLILFTGDNGTENQIYSRYNNSTVKGGKGNTTIYGTRVPMLAYWPGTIAPGTKNDSLIDFTDFLPSIADITNTPHPTDFGVLDGVSFAPYIKNTGITVTPRSSVYCWYFPKHLRTDFKRVYANNKTYKLYEDGYGFFNIKKDTKEKLPIQDSQLTQEEVTIKANLQQVLNSYH